MRILALLCLVLSTSLPVHASFWGSDDVSTVEASGDATIKAAATEAQATVTATAQARTSALVSDALAKQSQSLLAFLKESGKAREIATDSVEISPRTQSVNGADRIIGYEGSVAVRFKSSIGDVGDLISGALRNGASESGGYDALIGDADLQIARKQALDAAVKDALWKARAALDAAGLKEKGIRKITVSSQSQNALPMMKGMIAMPAPAGSGSIPVEGGTQEVTANATVVLEFTRK